MPQRYTPELLDRLISTLSPIRDHMVALEQSFGEDVRLAAREYRQSARNLLHYLGLRQHELRELQMALSAIGLSSLGRLEASALAGVDAVLAALHRLAERPMDRPDAAEPPIDFRSGPELLAVHTEALLGPPRGARASRIMVTMPSEAAVDRALVHDLLLAGMDVMRINAAHDGPAEWTAMVRNLRRAIEETGIPCRVLLDLGGPKLRTGPMEACGRILRIRPRRDARGRVIQRARVELRADLALGETGSRAGAPWRVPIDGPGLEAVRPGDTVHLQDARGRRRVLRVTDAGGAVCVAELDRTAYVESGSPLEVRRGGAPVARWTVGPLPEVIEGVLLRTGDEFFLRAEDAPGVPEGAAIGCTLGAALADAAVGHRVWLDDGKIGGEIVGAGAGWLRLRVVYTRPGGAKLLPDKGINFPDSELSIQGLTEKDIADLAFAARNVDMVGLSFVQSVDDVLRLEHELDKCGGSHIGIVLKIETRRGFENLPRLLLASLRSPPVGVMVARGDLAVEVGFERMAEVQEEILWLCEAAHVPVIWATQVLEGLAKGGAPSRAEVTDAAMAGRAECVMLNKGPHIVEAVRFLGGVLDRMTSHQKKKRAMLRKLKVSTLEQRAGSNP